MSDLQDALDYFDGKKRKVPPGGHFPVVMEAARLVANLNLDGVRDLYLNDNKIARFMDRTGFIELLGITEDTE